MINVVDFANAVWFDASSEYQNRIPQATRENILEVGNAIVNYEPARNEFCSALINKIGKTIVSSKMAKNKLAFFRGEDLGFGDTIEDIFVEMAKASPYNRNETNPFGITKPQVKVLYHRIDRELQYFVTIYDADLKRAFTSADGLDKLVSAIVNSLYSGKEHDDYVFTKQLFGSYKKYYEVNVSAPTTDATCKALLKAIKKYSEDISFASKDFNGQGVETWTEKDEQILLMHKDAKVNCDIEYLAGIFNLSKAEMETRIVTVDDFGDLGDTYAILCDVNAPKIHKTLETMETIRNPKGRYTNYVLNSDGIYSISEFANMVVFKKKTDAKVTFTETNNVDISIVVVDSNGDVIQPLSDGKYRLPVGSYTYTAKATGYVTQSDVALTITSSDVSNDKTVTVTMVANG